MNKKPNCKKCIFRAKSYEKHGCNFLFVTGHTRKAEPPETCKDFREGARMERREYLLLQEGLQEKAKRQRAPGGGRKEEHDWDKARKPYDEGYNDGQIARVMGLRPQTVCEWRKRNNLPANTTTGGRRRVKDWDYVRELYERGLNDREIADEVNVTDNVIYKWRKRHSLQANTNSGGQRKKRNET